MEIDLDIIESQAKKKFQQPYVNWKKLSSEQKSNFQVKMSDSLSKIHIPRREILHGIKCCQNDEHKMSIEQYFLDIVSAVME